MGEAARLARDLGKLADANDALRAARDAARRDAVAGIREVERALKLALAADRLRLPNVSPAHRTPLRAYYVRATGDRVDVEGRTVLCLTDAADLEMVSVHETTLERRPALDADLYAQDLPAYVATVRRALAEHLRRSRASAATYAAVSRLAGRLRAVAE